MSTDGSSEHPLTGELGRLVARTIEDQQVSAARARQLRWVAGELGLALAHPDYPIRRPADLRELFAAEPVTAYLALAARGELRRRAINRDPTATDASMRIRADCLRMLAATAAVPLTVPGRPGMPALREVVEAPARDRLLAFLEDRAGWANSPPGRVRLLAIVGVVLDTGARVGELCALRLDDLSEGLRDVRVLRKPQARSVSEPRAERIALTAGTRGALHAWLDVRAELVANLHGPMAALWVSVAGNHAGTLAADGRALRRPAGMPLRPRGLQRAYTRGVAEANVALAGSPGWHPLPYRLEQLRRAVEVTPEAVGDQAAADEPTSTADEERVET
jgi:integrase